MKKWGSLEDLETEKSKRVERKEKKALEKAKEAEKGIAFVFLTRAGIAVQASSLEIISRGLTTCR